jgi:hypothetical protein
VSRPSISMAEPSLNLTDRRTPKLILENADWAPLMWFVAPVSTIHCPWSLSPLSLIYVKVLTQLHSLGRGVE